MGKTFRTVDPNTKNWLPDNPRKAAMLMKGAKRYSKGAAGWATTDAEGNFKRNTWDDVSCKAKSSVTRDIRHTAKVQIRRQLAEMNS